MSDAPSIGLVMTVKNEQRLLRRNLLYHHALGIDVFFIFDDGSSDRTPESVADLPFVQVRPGAGTAEPRAESLRLVEVRQVLNAQRALDLARAQGLDWLAHLDADELLCPDRTTAEPGLLKASLAQVQGADVVFYRCFEAVQRNLEGASPFEQETLFKAPGCRWRRHMYDPARDETFQVPAFLGHRLGKSAVRVGPGLIADVHHFRRPRRPLRRVQRDYLLHYFCCTLDDFTGKFRSRAGTPAASIGGRGLPRKRSVWLALVNDQDDARRIRSYYERWIAVGEEELAAVRAYADGTDGGRPALVEVTAARDVCRRLAAGGWGPAAVSDVS